VTSAEILDLLKRLELSLLDPAVRSSADKLSPLIADDFTEFGASGGVYDKRQVLSALPQELPRTDTKISNLQVKLLSDGVALVTYRAEYIASNGKTVRSLRSSLWRQRDGHWQMTFHQGTPAP
jgi:hypothetical protein